MARNTYRLTSEDKKFIRAAALKIVGMRACVLRVVVMAGNLSDSESPNALLVAASRAEAETIDQLSWADFCAKSVRLTEDGNAVLDVAVYDVPPVGEDYVSLRDHVGIEIKNRKITKVTGNKRVNGVWEKTEITA